jgi:hypothetical protein
MATHWDNFPTLRTIDAAYLLAGMKPLPGLKGIRGAPALVSNMLNLIADRTGAVALATMPEQRDTITQSEFQSLMDDYAVKPAPVVALNAKTGEPFCEALQQPEYQMTPEYQAEYARALENLDAAAELGKERKKWEDTPAVTVSELERKEQKIAALSASIDALNASIFPTQPQPVHEPAPVVVPAKETTEQRRARWLVMLEAEEKRGKLGALQRVADREGVDRSNMRKDIEKARAIRTEQSRAGFIVSQLVQDGKRKG